MPRHANRDPLPFHEPYQVEDGAIRLVVMSVTQEPRTFGSSTSFRPASHDTPFVSLHRDYHVELPNQDFHNPIPFAGCRAEFYPSANYQPNDKTLPLLETFFSIVETTAAGDGIRLHPCQTATPHSYWTTEIVNRNSLGKHPRYSASPVAYRPDPSLPEPLVLALHRHLCENQPGFQLTVDTDAPTVGLTAILADPYWWTNAADVVEYLQVQRDASPDLNHHVFQSVAMIVSFSDGCDDLFVNLECLPLNDEYDFLATRDAEPHRIQHLLTMANATESAYAEYHPDDDIQELFSEVGVTALFKAWDTKSPGNGELIRALHQAIPAISRHAPPTRPVTVRHNEHSLALIAHNAHHRFTAVPADMLHTDLHPHDGDPTPGLDAIRNFVESDS